MVNSKISNATSKFNAIRKKLDGYLEILFPKVKIIFVVVKNSRYVCNLFIQIMFFSCLLTFLMLFKEMSSLKQVILIVTCQFVSDVV